MCYVVERGGQARGLSAPSLYIYKSRDRCQANSELLVIRFVFLGCPKKVNSEFRLTPVEVLSAWAADVTTLTLVDAEASVQIRNNGCIWFRSEGD